MVKAEVMADKSLDQLSAAFETVAIAPPVESSNLRKPQNQCSSYRPQTRKNVKSRMSDSAASKSTPQFVRGNCISFCPTKEIQERTRLKLLHYFEWKNGRKHVPGIVVKCFVRPAAGKLHLSPEELRTLPCLQNTIEYLFNEVLLDERKPYHFVYDFIFDRLRAVRQDTIIQNFKPEETIVLFEPIIMFLSYSRYKLVETAFIDFDPKICEHHLHECINKTLTCYNDLAASDSSTLRRRAFIEAIYLIVNLGKEEALRRYFALPSELKAIDYLKDAYRMSLNYMLGNYYRTTSIMSELPHVLCALASLHLPFIRKHILRSFSIAYSSNNNPVSLEFVRSFTLHANNDALANELCHYKLEILNDPENCVQFRKNKFDQETAPPPPHKELFVENKFQQISDLNQILLLKDL